jgi:hypothetical protein
MAEENKKPSWSFPGSGPGTLSGFFVAWVFVAGIVGLAVLFMSIGEAPLPLRVVGYDVSVGGQTPTPAQIDTLVPAIRQANPMVLAIQGCSEEMVPELARKLEVKQENVASEGSSAILSRYKISNSQGGRLGLIEWGKVGKFGIVSVDLREGADARARLKEAVELAKKGFGRTPHAVLAQAGSVAPDAPDGYVLATATKQEATDWRVYVPKDVEDNLEECYVPAENAKIKDFSERIPIVARFVFHKKDFQ